MKIALINENSQAAKNELICKTVYFNTVSLKYTRKRFGKIGCKLVEIIHIGIHIIRERFKCLVNTVGQFFDKVILFLWDILFMMQEQENKHMPQKVMQR